jgi:hypothetical protein
MPAWKVLVIGLLACVCLALSVATLLVAIAREWLWAAGLFPATLFTVVLFVLFLRYAGGSLDLSPRGARR